MKSLNGFWGFYHNCILVAIGMILLFAACEAPVDNSGSPVSATPITSVGITVAAPSKGAMPNTTASGTGNFTIGVMTWSPVHSRFLGSTTYTATIMLNANSGYTFEGLTYAIINGQNATISNNSGAGVTLSLAFSPTPEKTVTDISVKTQPTLLSYMHGDQLDLTGLVVTLTYDDTTTEDVTHTDFVANNITISHPHGHHLSHADHHDQPVTITYGDLTPLHIGYLTVNPIPIADVEVNVNVPVKNGTPQLAEGYGHFTVSSTLWEPNHSSFLGGVVYTVAVTLTAASNYTFSGLNSATIDGETMTVSNNTGKTITLSYTFEATDSRDVKDIGIKTQPTKLAYTHGDQIDLTGLVVTLTYDDTTTEDVAFANFTAKGITAHPAQNNHLVRATHHGHPITITYGDDLTCFTNSVTVNPRVITFSVDQIVAQTYTGSEIRPEVTVRYGGEILTLDADYTVAYANNTSAASAGAGLATVMITGAGNYAGSSGNRMFIINPKVIGFTVDPISEQIYTGGAIRPTVTVKDGTTELILNTDYMVSYTDNTIAGTATVTITGRGNYLGSSGGATFTILQTVSPNRIEYYWVDEHGSLVTTSNGVTSVVPGGALIITAQGTGYDVKQWHLDGVDTGQGGNTYNFSSTANGKHVVGLFVEKDGQVYNTNIIINVTPTISVTFNANGGSLTSSSVQQVSPGTAITLPSAPSRTNYTFAGWNTNSAGTGTNYNASSSYRPPDNITLYARWTFTVTFSVNSGTGTAPVAQTVSPASSITLPSGSGLSRSGYTFSGWNTNSSGTGTNYTVGTAYTPTGNVTLYARWITSVTVTFNINSGTGTAPTSQTVATGSSITLPSGSGLSRTGYTFGGWNTGYAGNGTNYITGASYTPTGNVTLYARWLQGEITTITTSNSWADGNISSSNGEQWFTFTATASTQYIHVIFTTLTDLYVQVYDSNLNIVGSATYLFGSTRYTSRSLTNGQVYYVRVWPYSSSERGTYRIAFNTSATAPY